MEKKNYIVDAIIDGERVSYTLKNTSPAWATRIARSVGASLFYGSVINIINLIEV